MDVGCLEEVGDVSFEQEGLWREELSEAEFVHTVKEEILFAETESTLNRINLGSKDAETPIWDAVNHGATR